MKICYMSFKSIHIDRCLKWMVNRGHEVHLISNQPSAIKEISMHPLNFENERGLKFGRFLHFNFNGHRWTQIKTFLKVREIIKKIYPDVLHLHTLYNPSYYGVFANICPLIISPWNGDILWTPVRSAYYKFFVRYALRKADAVTSDNKVMEEGCLGYGVKRERIHVIGWYGANLKKFRPGLDCSKLKENLKINDSPIILSPRSLMDSPYNIDVIIKSIPLVLKEVPNAKFVFIWFYTNKEHLNKMQKLVSKLNVNHAVRFVGSIDYDDIPFYYNLANAMVSIASPDSTPASLYEAMACGVPPIVSDVPAITEFVKDGWNGYVVPPREHEALAKAIIELLKNDRIHQLFRERNFELVKGKADVDKEMRKVEELYYKLLEGRRGTGS